MRMNIKGIVIMIGGTHSTGALNILVEEGAVAHPTMKGMITQITLGHRSIRKISNNFDLIHRQQLATAALSAIKEFDGTNKSSTIPWLDQVELVAERNNTNPIEIGISKLVGIPLRNMITIKHEKGNLTWYRFQQVLIENYLDIPCVSDAMSNYMKITQERGVRYIT